MNVPAKFRTLTNNIYKNIIPERLRVAVWEWRWHRKNPHVRSAQEPSRRILRGMKPLPVREPRKGSELKQGVKHIFIFARQPFTVNSATPRFAYLAKTLHDMGHIVSYIYASGSPRSEQGGPWLPVVDHSPLGMVSTRSIAASLRGEPVFVFEGVFAGINRFVQLASLLKAQVIYEHLDAGESQIIGNGEAASKQLLQLADVITVRSSAAREHLAEVLREHAGLAKVSENVVRLPNAADIEHYEPLAAYDRPTDLIQADLTLLAYLQVSGELTDWLLIAGIAQALPTCNVNLIGSMSREDFAAKSLPGNVHLLGPKSPSALPAYVAHSDVILFPFTSAAFTDGALPPFAFDSIAMHRRVVAPAFLTASEYPLACDATTTDNWIACLRAWGCEPVLPDSDLAQFRDENSWFARCSFLLDTLDQKKDLRAHNNTTSQPSLSVIVLNHNNGKVIGRCVDSVLRNSTRYNVELIVVDNASVDGSSDLLEQMYGERITVVRNPKNGCSSGRNLGVANSHGDYILFLDSDQWALSEHWLDMPLRILDSHPDLGAVGWGAGWFSKHSLGGPIAEDLPHRGVAPGQAFRADIAYLGTNGLLLPRRIWDAIDGFDERYDPTIFEDTDLSLQIKHLGLDLAYCPSMNLYHLPHQTTNAGSAAHSALWARNSVYFAQKWLQRDPQLLQCYLRQDSHPASE